jgi:hypothetical protein
LYYLFGSDLLQAAINQLANQGKISKPIETYDPNFPIIQHADDTLLIMPADRRHIIALREELHKFSMSTWLNQL